MGTAASGTVSETFKGQEDEVDSRCSVYIILKQQKEIPDSLLQQISAALSKQSSVIGSLLGEGVISAPMDTNRTKFQGDIGTLGEQNSLASQGYPGRMLGSWHKPNIFNERKEEL